MSRLLRSGYRASEILATSRSCLAARPNVRGLRSCRLLVQAKAVVVRRAPNGRIPRRPPHRPPRRRLPRRAAYGRVHAHAVAGVNLCPKLRGAAPWGCAARCQEDKSDAFTAQGSRGVILSGISVAHGLEGCVRRAKEGAHDSSHNAVRLVGFVVVRSSGPGERRRWWRWRRRRRRRRCWCRKLGRRSWRRQWGGSRRRRQWGGSRRRADGRCLARSRSRDCHIQPR
jgi:hypothetical protein